MKLNYKNKMTVAAHRGDSYNCYENTMEAYKMGVENGADMLEIDVRLTKDKVLVLHHDEAVDRTTDGTGLVCEKTYEELCKLNAGDKNMPLKIPTLEEFFEFLKDTNVMLNLEIKEYYKEGNIENCHYCIDESVKMVEKYGYADKMIFNSFDAHVLEYIDEKYNGKYMLHGYYPYSIMKNVKRNPDEYLYCACIFDDKNKANYDYLISKNIEPWVGAKVTTKEHLKLCYELGANLVTTNNPKDAIEKLSQENLR